MEFNKEELIFIKDIMNAWDDLSEENSELAEAIWQRLDDEGIEDIKEYEKTTEYFIEKLRDESSESTGCDNYTYDCQDMPDDVRSEFFDSHRAGNDCHVTHYVSDDIVGVFLIEELGCEVDDEVIVKHWW